jgi:tetratricopeptide (TPR) repeat protein
MKITNWAQLPDDYTFNYDLEQLTQVWEQLHIGDQEVYPLDYEGDTEALTAQANAWLQFHNGDFAKAAQMALDLGEDGVIVLARSIAVYCDYLCEDEDEALAILKECMDKCEEAAAALPDFANYHFVCALIMGRYSQRISITKALAQGLGGKIKSYLEKTLELEPNHAEAHTAMGLYHAEIIDKVGAMLGGLTYGAKKPIAMKHFETSLELNPDTAITSIEFANGLLLLGANENKANKHYQHAAQCNALDAQQNCDVSFAQEQID